MVNIAVLGYGTVGSGVVEVLRTNQESINKRAGQEINLKYVLDLRDFPGDPVEKYLFMTMTLSLMMMTSKSSLRLWAELIRHINLLRTRF